MPQNDLLPAILEAFALPPGPSIALLIFALLSRRPGSRRLFLILGLVSLYLCSIPVTSNWLMGRLEVFPPVSLEKIAAEAIVVLGSDRHREAKEYGGDTMNGSGLERLRYAARLGKTTGLPILTSGGLARQDDETPEAELMGAALKEFGLEARWLEGNSRKRHEFEPDIKGDGDWRNCAGYPWLSHATGDGGIRESGNAGHSSADRHDGPSTKIHQPTLFAQCRRVANDLLGLARIAGQMVVSLSVLQ